MSEIYEIKLKGKKVEVEKDDDGKFIIPDKFRNNHTNLKPAHEPILLAQKPREGTYCENIDKWGVGGINVDECRVGIEEWDREIIKSKANKSNTSNNIIKGYGNNTNEKGDWEVNKGRFPANLLLTHHPVFEYKGEKKVGSGERRKSGYREGGNPDYTVGLNGKKDAPDSYGTETVSDWDCHPSCPVRRMNEQSGECKSGGGVKGSKLDYENPETDFQTSNSYRPKGIGGDTGGAARYFNQFHFVDEDFFKYTAKASKSERTCDGNVENDHPTVKPIELMKWLVRLVTPPEGIVVDPFCGSGTTCISAYEEGFDYIGMDNDKHSVEIARERVKYHRGKSNQLELF